MKWFCVCIFFSSFQTLSAGNPYRLFLLLQSVSSSKNIEKATISTPLYAIPKYQVPRGAVFCRMEDKLTKATGIWIKIGVR